MPRPAPPLRLSAIELAMEFGEVRRGLLRVEKAHVIRNDREPSGKGRERLTLVIEGEIRGIPDRYTGGGGR